MEINKTVETRDKEIKIFPATTNPSDIRGTQEVFYKTWLATYPNNEHGITVDDVEDRFKDKFTEEALSKMAQRVENLPENMYLFLAKDGDKVIGVCRIEISNRSNNLKAIYVLPEYQRKGIGGLLWEKAQEVFESGKDVIVDVATYNTQAINFYEKLGFKDTGERFMEERTKMKSGANIPQMEMIRPADKL